MVLRMASPKRHPNTGVYYFRRRVPADLVKVLGKKEIKRSLGTKDCEEAKRLCATMWQQVQAEWDQLRRTPEPVSLKTIMALAGEAYRQLVETVDEDPGKAFIWDAVLNRNNREFETGRAEQWYGPTADKLLSNHGIKADQPSRERLLKEIHKAIQQGAEVSRRKAEGDYRPDPDADRFPNISNNRAGQKASPVSLLDLFEAWRKEHEREGRAASTVKGWKRNIDEFVTFIGHSDANKVTLRDVIAWRQHLKNERGLKSKTVNGTKLASLQSVFSAGKRLLLIDHDPTNGAIEKIGKAKKERPKGFTDGEAKRVLEAALRANETSGGTAYRTKFAFRWLPWLCAYTGARAGESAQLRKQDVVSDGVPFIRITPEAGTVKTGQFREVPLHPHLIEQGFLEFVENQPDGPLFFEPKAKSTRSPGDSVRDKVAKWVRETAKIADERIQPNHAWRHRFKTVSRDVGIHREYADAIQGHSDGSASSGYGEVSVKALFREIKKLPRYKVD